ncbi:hypothetical protein ACFWFI_02800 [Streptomyces sp. NPDC060209]|uniref:hypothetical protein n=1 Tax=Streptomyces sp. NPDC060209 TaxID=3347073 RepID=UPI00364F6AAB
MAGPHMRVIAVFCSSVSGRYDWNAKTADGCSAASIALLPQRDGTLDPVSLRAITNLPTVAAATALLADAPVRAGQVAGWLLLVANDYSSRTTRPRSAEQLALYAGAVPHASR